MATLDMVRIRVYDGKGRSVGDLDVPAFSTQVWLSNQDEASTDLADIRDIVDPDGLNRDHDWDIWARPAEVREDLGVGRAGKETGPGGLLSLT